MIAHARTTDPVTSHAAAASVGDLRTSQYAVLKVLRKRAATGFTHEELVEAYPTGRPDLYPRQSPQGIRSRCKELQQQGFVYAAGDKRPMSTGRMALVWRVVDKK